MKRTFRIRDRLTPADRKIYERMPFVGRLMVHWDRREAWIMDTLTRELSGRYARLTQRSAP